MQSSSGVPCGKRIRIWLESLIYLIIDKLIYRYWFIYWNIELELNLSSKCDWNYLKSKCCHSPLVLFNFLAEAHSLIVLIGIDVLRLILIFVDINIWYWCMIYDIDDIDCDWYPEMITPNLLLACFWARVFQKLPNIEECCKSCIQSIHSY